MLPLRALVLSPFATTPADAGQRRRVRQTTRLLRDSGFSTTFLLYAFEDGWKTKANEPWLAEMRRDWNEVIVWGASGKVGMPPASGDSHALDEWWDEKLETVIRQLFTYRFYDLFVVNNVWLSKAFEFAPRGTVRLLDTHDIFSMRKSYFRRAGATPEFFLPEARDEANGVNRADIALGIQANDAEWLSQNTSAESHCLPYPGDGAIATERTDYLHGNKVVFGFVGAGHVFNTDGLRAYCGELKEIVGRTASPVELRIGGRVCEAIEGEGPWIPCGYVEDEAKFFDRIDIAVVPVFGGSGFKVKVADAAASGKPLIASAHAAIGTALDSQYVAQSPGELARMTARMALHRPSYRALLDASQRCHRDLQIRTGRAARKLIRKIDRYRRTIAYDLTGLSANEAACVLLSWCGAFHVARPYAKQLIVAADPRIAEYNDLMPPGVFFASKQEVTKQAHQIWRWITVANGNLESWGARREDIRVDSIWAGALERQESDAAQSICTDGRGACFWHSVSWDLMARNIIKCGTRDCDERAGRMKETVLAVDSRRSDLLLGPIRALYGEKLSIVSLDEFATFRALLMQIAAGRVRRIAVGTSRRPQRAAILRDLCAVKKAEFRGPAARGGLVEGTACEASVQAMYRRFEEQWRPGKQMMAARR